MTQKTRAFICATFPDEVNKEIARIQSLVEKIKFTGKLTELENLHLTLKFLGEISQEELDKAKEQLSKIKFKKFQTKLGNIGIFNYRKKPRIVWIKLIGKVFDLQKKIDEALSPHFKKEERFMSHLTIARVKYIADKIGFQKYIKNISVKPISFPVNEFRLMSSELKPLHPIYTTLEKYKSSSQP